MVFDTLADAIDYCIDNGPKRIVRVIKTGKISCISVKSEDDPVPSWATLLVSLYKYPMTTTNWLVNHA